MKKIECVRLAFYNLKTFKESTKQYFLSIFMVTFFLMLFISISLVVNELYDDIIYDSISTNNVYVFLNLDSNGELVQNAAVDLLEHLDKNENIMLGPRYECMDLSPSEEHITEMGIDNVTCRINNVQYKGENDYSFDFFETKKLSNKEDKELFHVLFSVDILDLQSNMYTENVLKEYTYKYDSDMFLCGRELQGEKEILISDYMLNRFGIYEYEEVLNKNISFYVNDQLLIEDYLLVGVVNSDYFRVTSQSQVLISGTRDLYIKENVEEMTQVVSLGEFKNSQKILESIDIKYEDYYSSSMIIYTYEMIDKLRALCQKIISVFVVIIIVAMIIKLISNMYVNRKRRLHYYGMLKAMGMENKTIMEICLYELLVLLCTCMLLSFILSIVALILFRYIISGTMGYDLVVSGAHVCTALLSTGSGIVILMILLSVILNLDMKKKSIVDVMNS